MSREPRFNLLDSPWIIVRRIDDSIDTLSMLQVFEQADDIAAITGETPTQNLAVLRLLLAAMYRSGGETVPNQDQWLELHHTGLPVESITAYLEKYRDRFWLDHPTKPFMQVPETMFNFDGKGIDPKKLLIVQADLPSNIDFLAARSGETATSLTMAEAARWLLHAHAFDWVGLKTKPQHREPDHSVDESWWGVSRVSAFPSSIGRATSIYLEADTLAEQLILNFVGDDTSSPATTPTGRPVWEREQQSAVVRRTAKLSRKLHHALQLDKAEGARGRAPSINRDLSKTVMSFGDEPCEGIADAYTWTSRVVQYSFSDEGRVTGVIVAYGDYLHRDNPQLDPMTVWNVQSVYADPVGDFTKGRRTLDALTTSQQHTPAGLGHRKSLWRRSNSLLVSTDETKRPGVMQWLAKATTLGALPPDAKARVAGVGVEYDPKGSYVRDIFHDTISHPTALLLEEYEEHLETALQAVSEATKVGAAIGNFEEHLSKFSSTANMGLSAKERLFSDLDHTYRRWVFMLTPETSATDALQQWRESVWVAAMRCIRQTAKHVSPRQMFLPQDSASNSVAAQLRSLKYQIRTALSMTNDRATTTTKET